MSQSSGDLEELPAYLQRQIQIAGYIFVGSTSVFIWDILNNLRNDYALFFKKKFHVACLAYAVSRIASLMYVLGFTVFATYPLQACNTSYVVGANLPAFSKALFVDGQMYYMITVLVNILATLLVYIPSISPVYHGVLVVPSTTLTSIMACRVYRNTKLGITRGTSELALPTLNSNAVGTIPLSVVQFSTQPNRTTGWEGDGSGSSGDKDDTLNESSKANNSGFSPTLHHDTGIAP
ncbi:hypothetical protein FB451DRAFT_1549650 [Mycena latifolia]|nr:hypothetical protein FB451DRAFT_1549650 [Mycena latifolia]